MTDAINEETKGAVKLSRTDAVKLVAARMGSLAAEDLDRCEQVVINRRDLFRRAVCEKAELENDDVLGPVLDAVRGLALHSTTPYCVYEDGADSGDTAQVIFSDHQQPYEARMRIAVDVALGPAELRLANEWRAALVAAKDARERDLRVGSMKREAREALIKAALDDTGEGRDVIAAVRILASALKAKV